jgi:hypothetical protein
MSRLEKIKKLMTRKNHKILCHQNRLVATCDVDEEQLMILFCPKYTMNEKISNVLEIPSDDY